MNWSASAGEFSGALQALAASGVRVGLLSEAPPLSLRGQLAMTIWGDLAGERQIGPRLGPIPWRAIVAWCDRYRVRDAETLIELVQAIDAAWLTDDPKTVRHHENSGHPQAPVRH